MTVLSVLLAVKTLSLAMNKYFSSEAVTNAQEGRSPAVLHI